MAGTFGPTTGRPTAMKATGTYDGALNALPMADPESAEDDKQSDKRSSPNAQVIGASVPGSEPVSVAAS